jgi:prepilin-type N-terminal cleavage/methylation domain-containing protein/prepilin-type processing-associated H-X9-DG protein
MNARTGRNGRPRVNSGFTLIELLVVIAIISTLAAILFPVFAQARAKARQTANINNLKQIGLAVLQYAQDYDESVVPYAVRAGGGSTLNNRYWFGTSWTAAAAPYNAPPYTDAPCPSASCNLYLDPNDGLLAPYLKNADIFDDPNARDLTPAFTNWRNGDRVPGYSVYPTLFPDLRVNPGDPLPLIPSLADVQEAAQTVLMVDAASLSGTTVVKSIFIRGPWSYTSTGALLDNSSAASGVASPRLHARHTGAACVLWADGHVSVARPRYRPAGTSATLDQRRARNIGEFSPVDLPAAITAGDPNLARYNYYFALNKTTGI